VLSLHGLGDYYVPFSMEQVYAAEAQRQGTDGLLVQRAVRTAGHCEFTPQEAQRAFADLVRWVESRGGEGREARPGGDDVLDRREVASAAFGCRWTTPAAALPAEARGTRELYAPCPRPAAG
jgi:hypothetical protein